MLSNLLFFILGVLTTLALVAIIVRYKKRKKASRAGIRQSAMFLFIKNFMPELIADALNKQTQAAIYDDSKFINYIEMPDKKVYWISRSVLYYADIAGGRFDPKEGKLLKTRNLPEKEINKVLYIMNSLRDG
jgi:molecular chaperone GrpE (heat shock protein)